MARRKRRLDSVKRFDRGAGASLTSECDAIWTNEHLPGRLGHPARMYSHVQYEHDSGKLRRFKEIGAREGGG